MPPKKTKNDKDVKDVKENEKKDKKKVGRHLPPEEDDKHYHPSALLPSPSMRERLRGHTPITGCGSYSFSPPTPPAPNPEQVVSSGDEAVVEEDEEPEGVDYCGKLKIFVGPSKGMSDPKKDEKFDHKAKMTVPKTKDNSTPAVRRTAKADKKKVVKAKETKEHNGGDAKKKEDKKDKKGDGGKDKAKK